MKPVPDKKPRWLPTHYLGTNWAFHHPDEPPFTARPAVWRCEMMRNGSWSAHNPGTGVIEYGLSSSQTAARCALGLPPEPAGERHWLALSEPEYTEER